MKKQYISFQNHNNTALLLTTSSEVPYTNVLESLHIEQPKAILLVIGGAGNMEGRLKNMVAPLCRDGIAAAAVENNALVIDGGTQSGVMELMGHAVAAQGHHPPLLGIAPEGLVTYPGAPKDGGKINRISLDPNHSHFVLVEGNKWGDETPMLYGLTKELASDRPIVTLLLNGGDITQQEVLHSIQAGWPVIVVAGSGGLADEIAMLWHKKHFFLSLQCWFSRNKDSSNFIHRQKIIDIIKDGDIHLFPSNDEAKDLKALIKRLFLEQKKSVLVSAWKRCKYYRQIANQHQHTFRLLWLCTFGLSILTVILNLLKTQATLSNWLKAGSFWDEPMNILISLIGIATALLLGLSPFFRWGSKWVSLRTSAEALKREMYYYRTHMGNYSELGSESDEVQKAAEKQLLEKINAVNVQLAQAEINPLPDSSRALRFPLPRNASDKGNDLGDLTSEQYFHFRLKDQLDYYCRRTKRWEHFLGRYKIMIFLFGAVGGLLGALQLGFWFPLPLLLVLTLTLHLEQTQVTTTVMKYKQAIAALENVRQWWVTLTVAEQKKAENFQKLVETTEQILQDEQESWLQQMYDAISRL